MSDEMAREWPGNWKMGVGGEDRYMEGSADAQTLSFVMFCVMEGYHLRNIYIAAARYPMP